MNVIYSYIIYNKKLQLLPTCTARLSFLLFAKIFLSYIVMVSSFRMMSFPPREAMTTAEPPEPSRFRGAKSLKLKAESKYRHLAGRGPAARHSV